ncbi:MAG: glycine/betaine/sarcosine/D-proline family reductase selenoprotein B [Desulfobacterales bacterium]|nr:glycine/betaine/sarcosine/D-proline family reductase selenoprotein B [Desulfobacterales bacterium]
MSDTEKESFEDFIKSFFYGSRSDLSFKFISDFSEDQASDFLRRLFKTLVDAVDDEDLSAVKHTIMDGQALSYGGGHLKGFTYEEGPFVPMDKPLSEARLSLLTSSGHFVAGDDPNPLGTAGMTQAEAESRIMEFIKEPPQLSAIPFDTPGEKLQVRHGGYDIRGARKDPNSAFPFERMKDIRAKGGFKALTPNAYSFVGACAQTRLLKETLPGWTADMKAEAPDAVVLVPV